MVWTTCPVATVELSKQAQADDLLGLAGLGSTVASSPCCTQIRPGVHCG